MKMKIFFSIPDINPKVKGHSLILSKKHFRNILEMPSNLGTELLDCVKYTSLKLTKEYSAGGFNIINNNFGAAGQVVDHFHLHILPRKENDNFKLEV